MGYHVMRLPSVAALVLLAVCDCGESPETTAPAAPPADKVSYPGAYEGGGLTTGTARWT
jgi:hypothetical protein